MVSQYLFLRTSGDISGLAEVIYFSWIFPLFWLILLGIRFHRAEKLLEPYFWKLVILILFLQLFNILFNNRLCTSGGSHNFIQNFLYKIMGGKITSLCVVANEKISESFPLIGAESWIPFEIIFFARILYYILNLILILIP